MAGNHSEGFTPPVHWLDELIKGVVEHNGDQLSANQLLNAIMHSPAIVNAIQGAISDRAPDGIVPLGFAAEFAREIRQVFVEVVARSELMPLKGDGSVLVAKKKGPLSADHGRDI